MENLTPTLLIFLSASLAGGSVAMMAFTLWPRNLIAEAAQRRAESATTRAARQVFFERMAPFSKPLLTRKREASLQRRLLMMGEPDLRPVDIISMQILSAVSFSLLFGLLFYGLEVHLLWSALPGAVGLLLPVIWMRDRIKRRHLQIGRDMPFNLDLLTLSVEAGMDFAGAALTVVERGIPGPLTEEMGIMMREIRLGKTRAEALRNMSERCGYSPLTQFVSNLIQAEKMGTSLGRVLRVQSTQLRIARTQRAEKLANEAPVKMLFPLIFCIFPTVFMILFGPIVYQFIEGGP